MLANKELTNNVWRRYMLCGNLNLSELDGEVEKHNDQLCLVVSQDQIKVYPLEAAGINLIGDERLIKSALWA